MAVYVTGDTHGDFRQIGDFCSVMGTKRDDVMIVLGDAGLNYFGDERDIARKTGVSRTRMTYLMIHGSHEMRPATVDRYKLVQWNGGAYSVDKEYRLRMGYRWFPDEQPSDEIKEYVEQQLDKAGWKVDAVLSHTCPRKYEPVEHFMPGIDQSKVDKSTENWLDTIEDRLDYKEWYCGHWHINKQADKLTFLFHDIRLFG